MRKRFAAFIILLLACAVARSQSVGINTSTPNASAALDVSATNKGLLLPRMTTAQRTAIVNPATGLMVYDTDTKSFWFREAAGWLQLQNAVAAKSVNGSATFTDVPLTPSRYIWELNGAHPLQNTIVIPVTTINELCGDDDGCKVTITMVNWAANETASSSASCNFFYSAVNGKWRTNDGFTTGTDNNGVVEHVLTLSSFVYFTDAAYSGPTGTDAAAGFGLMKWTGYPSTTVVRLILED
jgi:hypothetical protein